MAWLVAALAVSAAPAGALPTNRRVLGSSGISDDWAWADMVPPQGAEVVTSRPPKKKKILFALAERYLKLPANFSETVSTQQLPTVQEIRASLCFGRNCVRLQLTEGINTMVFAKGHALSRKALRQHRHGSPAFVLLAAMVAACTAVRLVAFVTGAPQLQRGPSCHSHGIDRASSRIVSLKAKTPEECKAEDENPMNKIKSLGTAGAISYALWEAAFWLIGGGGAVAAYVYANGHMPNFSNQDEVQQVGAEAFVFINGARLLVPVRIGLAVSTTPWIEENVVKKLFPKDEECVVPEDIETNAKVAQKA